MNWWLIILPAFILVVVAGPSLLSAFRKSRSNKQETKQQESPEKPNSPEKKEENATSNKSIATSSPASKQRGMNEYMSLAWTLLVLMCLAISVSVTLVVFMPWSWWLAGVALLTTTTSVVAFCYFGAPIFIRALADAGIFFVRVPEMTAAFIEKDRIFHRVIISCSDPQLRKHYVLLAKMKNDEARKLGADHDPYVLTSPGKEIVFMGLPWVYKLKEPWFEHSEDARNPDADPVRFLNLRVRTIDYLPVDEGGVIPNVDTTDPIEITASMVVECRIWDPWLAVYGVDVYLEAMQKMIVSQWRRIASSLSYFDPSSKTGSKDLGDINPSIQRDVYRKLNVEELHLAKISTDASGNDRIDPVRPKLVENADGTIGVENPFDSDSPAEYCQQVLGVIVHNLEVRDLDPLPEIRGAINRRAIAKADGAAAITKAELEAKAQEEEGKGKGAYIRQVQQAEADGIKARAQATQVPGGLEVLASDTTIGMGAKAQVVITEGGMSGAVGMWNGVQGALSKKSPTTKLEPGGSSS